MATSKKIKAADKPSNTSPRPGVTKKDGEVVASGVTIQNISIRPVQRSSVDISKWRTAHQNAESLQGSRIELYDMYDDVQLDGFLKRMIAKRVGGVTAHKLQFVDKEGKAIEQTADMVHSMEFRKLRKALLLQKAWGISVVELSNVDGKLHIFDVPKKHIKPAEGMVINNQYDQTGPIEYRKPPYVQRVVEVGDYNDLGFLLQAAAYVIYKRGDIADWANYAQIFGMPFREARYDGFNEQVRIQLEQALEKAGSAAYAVLPKEAELTFHEAKSQAGSADLYDKLRTAMNEEIMVLILGATETTTSSDSSGYAQSETHRKTVDEVVEDDMAEELAIMNEKVRPVMQFLGLLPDGQFVYDQGVDIVEANKKVDMGVKLRNAGVPVEDDWFYETTGIPKPADYDAQKSEIEAQRAAKAGAVTKDAAPPAKGKAGAKKTKLAGIEPEETTLEERMLSVLQKVESFFGEALD